VIVLDEPESHLDIKKQILILNILKKLVKEKEVCCLINTHYPDHALRIADKTILLSGDCGHSFDFIEEVITENNISRYFGVKARIVTVSENRQDIKMLCPVEITN